MSLTPNRIARRLRRRLFLLFLPINVGIIFVILFNALPAFAAETPGNGVDSTSAADDKPQRWVIVPVVARTPEMGWLGGGLFIHFFPTDRPGQRASSLDLISFRTTHDQFLIALAPKIYIRQDRYRIQPSVSWLSWKSQYYGIGSNTPDSAELYQTKSARAAVSATRFLDDCCFIRTGATVERSRNAYDSGGRIDSESIDGKDGGWLTGAGIGFGRDTRDNENATRQGALIEYRAEYYHESLASDYRYILQTVDARVFFPFRTADTLGIAFRWRYTRGEIPLRELSSPDGSEILRCIENGRYLDKDLYALQAEYRFPIWKRIGGTAFLETAQVSSVFPRLEKSGFIVSAGIGLRYALNVKERVNLRADFAWVDQGFGFVINIREAF